MIKKCIENLDQIITKEFLIKEFTFDEFLSWLLGMIEEEQKTGKIVYIT